MKARLVLPAGALLAGLAAAAAWPARFEIRVSGERGLRSSDLGRSVSIQTQARSILGTRTACWFSTTPRVKTTRDVAVTSLGPRDLLGCRLFVVTALGKAGDVAGTVSFDKESPWLPFHIAVAADRRDQDLNGYPDGAELRSSDDQNAFRAWFAAIAIQQASHVCDCWDATQRDCAGLARFAFREALKRHDARWRARMAWDAEPPAPDVQRFNYPEVPVLGDRIFRIRGGPFSGIEDFDVAPTAERLVAGSLEGLAADEPWATGDLLYFSDRAARVEHLMIVAGDQVVYHTGGDSHGSGEVRILRIESLRGHPDPAWHPDPRNPAFAGAYRWKILAHAGTRYFRASASGD